MSKRAWQRTFLGIYDLIVVEMGLLGLGIESKEMKSLTDSSLSSEIEGRSWTAVWDQILNSQPPGNDTADLDLDEWQDSNFFAQINENAESWAQNILAQQPELQPMAAPATGSVESQSSEADQDVCFGMVRTLCSQFRNFSITVLSDP